MGQPKLRGGAGVKHQGARWIGTAARSKPKGPESWVSGGEARLRAGANADHEGVGRASAGRTRLNNPEA